MVVAYTLNITDYSLIVNRKIRFFFKKKQAIRCNRIALCGAVLLLNTLAKHSNCPVALPPLESYRTQTSTHFIQGSIYTAPFSCKVSSIVIGKVANAAKAHDISSWVISPDSTILRAASRGSPVFTMEFSFFQKIRFIKFL